MMNFSADIIGASNGALSEANGDERGRGVPPGATAEYIVRSTMEAEDGGEVEDLEEHTCGRDCINVGRLDENERN